MELLEATIALVFHLVFDGRLGTSHGCRRKGGGENEAGGEGADGVNHFCGAGDVAANATICLSKSARDDINAVHDRSFGTTVQVSFVIKMLCYTSAVWSIHAYCMDFIEKGEGTVFLGQVTNSFNRSYTSAHTVDRFKSNDFW